MTLSRAAGDVPGGGDSGDLPALIADRYETVRAIGSGGMAIVYEARELRTGRRVALKQLKADQHARHGEHRIGLFEREFHTLMQLAHPRIVEVYDYGVAEQGPYYTMELLDGGDLHALAPLDWQRACAVFRDICSALSLLHSRRLVYRDLNTRNIRCTDDGRAKLIDFGAMAPMGPTRVVVGAPPCIAPEAVNLQPIDGRADLYSVGAGLYFALTGRHAYPARHLRQLRDLWRTPPTRLGDLVKEVPKALDDLVMELLQLNAGFRPSNAAEVMERLRAIASLPVNETLLVSQAYLSTPTLVGRDDELSQVRRKLGRASARRGSTTLIKGPAGVGRSRFIDACVLDAKLGGAIVLRADSSDAQSGPYGAARTLALQLFEAAPETASAAAERHLSLLGHVLPELIATRPDAALEPFADPEQLRPRLLAALRDLFLEVSQRKTVVLAVDDVHKIDEPSAAFVALIAHEALRHALAIVASAESGAPASSNGALDVLHRAGMPIGLGNLSSADTESLLESVFGDTPHVAGLAERLHTLADGNPRGVMHLAQHLVDQEVIRYESGAWTLPESIAAADLPRSVSEALRLRVDALQPSARDLARAIALSGLRALGFDDCLALRAGDPAAEVISDLDQLVRAEILRVAKERYGIAQEAWLPVLREGMDEETERALHRQLSQMFRRRGDEFRVVQHVMRSGHEVGALDLLIEHAERSQKSTDDNPEIFSQVVRSLPEDWYRTYDAAIALCLELGRPRRERFVLQSRRSGLMAVEAIQDTTHLAGLIDLLQHAVGLDLYAALDPALPPLERLQKSFEQAQARYAQSAEDDRVLEPVQAIRPLAQALIQACGIVATRYDYPFWKSLPSLEPLTPLTPALWVAEQLVQGLGQRITGRSGQARETYGALLERTAQADRAGLDESHHRYTRMGVMCGLGMLEAAMGREESLAWARAIESEPMHQVNAMLIRMLNHYWQGRPEDGDQIRKRITLLRIQNSSRQFFEGAHLVGEIGAHAALGDLPRLKRALKEVEQAAADAPGWVPIAHYARGEYHLILGETATALEAFDAALSQVAAGEHQIWPSAAGARLRTLLARGEAARAVEEGRALLARAEAAELGYATSYISMPLALSEAQTGHAAAAVRRAEEVIAKLEDLGCRGTNLGLAYECRARVAMHEQDRAATTEYAELAAKILRATQSRTGKARHARLVQDLREHFGDEQIGDALSVDTGGLRTDFTSLISTVMHKCDSAHERAYQGLGVLVAHSRSLGGYLYTANREALRLTALINVGEPTEDILRGAQQAMDAELDLNEVETETGVMDLSPQIPPPILDRCYRAIVMSHQCPEGFLVTGVAVLKVDPDVPFTPPNEAARIVSRLLVEAGDPALVV